MNLQTSVWSSYFVDLSPEEMVDEFARAGYSATEFSDEHGAVMLRRAAEQGITPAQAGEKLREYASERGVSFPQGHLFLKVDLCAPDAADILMPWLDLYVALGVRAAVLHTSCKQADLSPEERFPRWTAALKRLCAHLEGTEMSIALENAGFLVTAPEILSLIREVGSDHLGVCLDTGHLHLHTAMGRVPASHTQLDFIREAGDKLIALHIADNDTSRDEHLMPYENGTVDFVGVMQGLHEVGYHHLFNMEIPGERMAPLEVRRAKLIYLHTVFRVMLRDDFAQLNRPSH